MEKIFSIAFQKKLPIKNVILSCTMVLSVEKKIAIALIGQPIVIHMIFALNACSKLNLMIAHFVEKILCGENSGCVSI